MKTLVTTLSECTKSWIAGLFAALQSNDNTNTQSVVSAINALASARHIYTGGANIASGTFAGAALYGTSNSPALPSELQSVTVTVLKSDAAPLSGNTVKVVTANGTVYLTAGTSHTWTAEDEDDLKLTSITAQGNSAAIVTWTYEGA